MPQGRISTNLSRQVRKGAALIREGGVIDNVPMKHIELTEGHRILTENMYVNTAYNTYSESNRRLKFRLCRLIITRVFKMACSGK